MTTEALSTPDQTENYQFTDPPIQSNHSAGDAIPPRCCKYTSSTGVLTPDDPTTARISYQPTNKETGKPGGQLHEKSMPLSRLFPGNPETLKTLSNPSVGQKGEKGGFVLATFKDNHRVKGNHNNDGVALGLI